MPNKCVVASCNGNYNTDNRISVFKIPVKEPERSSWISALPKRAENNKPYEYPKNSYICARHWPGFPEEIPHVKVPGGAKRPTVAPFHFENVPPSCVPTPTKIRRVSSIEERQMNVFNERDLISNFEVCLQASKFINMDNVFMKSSTTDKCVFLIFDFTTSTPIFRGYLNIMQQTGTISGITVSAYDNANNKISISHCTLPNSQMNRWSQLQECINTVLHHEKTKQQRFNEAISLLSCNDVDPRTSFLIRQLELLTSKTFSKEDYLFAATTFPSARYEYLRDYLVLPSPRKMRELKSRVTADSLIYKVFKADTMPQQKVCIILVDEVKIKPCLIYQGHGVFGYSEDNPAERARSVLCVMVKCLHGGRSFIASLTPIFTLGASCMFEKVMHVIRAVHAVGGHVIAIVSDGLKTNVACYSLFQGYDQGKPWVVPHPEASGQSLYLLTDTVHLLKCIRNNWITEKQKQLKLGDSSDPGDWADVQKLYDLEKNSLLKLTPLTKASVQPSSMERQKVSLVLKTIDDKTIAAMKSLKCDKARPTISTLQFISKWWKIVNVKSVVESSRFNDVTRSAITGSECNSIHDLSQLASFFEKSPSGNGNKRVQSLTIDTKKALCRTTHGLVELSRDLLENFNFEYVLLGEIQQDKLEGEFGCWRQMCGGNMYMSYKDVDSSFKSRGLKLLAKLESLPSSEPKRCSLCDTDPDPSVLKALENLGSALAELTSLQIASSIYVAGYILKCNPEMAVDENDLIEEAASDFISTLSRGSLLIPDQQTALWVQLCFIFAESASLKCHRQLSDMICEISSLYDIFPLPPKSACRQLANVLLSGFQRRDFDQMNTSKQTMKLKRLSS